MGAYWRGTTTRCFNVSTALHSTTRSAYAHLVRLEEAAKRDHRKIGKHLDLFHMQQEAPCMVFWHHNGWTIFRELEVFIRQKLTEYDYQEVKGPLMMDRVLWERSVTGISTLKRCSLLLLENREYAIKPYELSWSRSNL